MIMYAMNKRQIEQDSTHASALDAEPTGDALETQEAEPAAVLALVMAEGSNGVSDTGTRATPADEDDKEPIKK
jgi:hypothetical protein